MMYVTPAVIKIPLAHLRKTRADDPFTSGDLFIFMISLFD
ncbi:hypothetical protein FSS13T_10050 [Flavobacterium saliperosum S13]|uniref:Uncharacterized protein n=1 Tax=Flavobacterium saliperosum S13 TaxID=1341155 RepID=A0ABN0QHT3_9FLAO|nr:hypothetical protein FSS13T_10050 [Flavobacterium saliperosum S13]